VASIEDFRLTSVSPRVFALSIPIRPNSIRDSMWRAERFCNQLQQAGLLTRGSNVLVVGTGPTGMTMTGAMLGMGARVVSCNLPPEDKDECLSACQTRVVCPTTFDFPVEHWRERYYPIGDDEAVLPWESTIAQRFHNRIAASLRDITEPIEATGDYYHAEPGFLDSVEPLDEKAVTVIIKEKGQVKPPAKVNLVVICVGPGRHMNVVKTSKGSFFGFGFWSNSDQIMNQPQLAAKKKVLILGGGDGGVGDFVRLVTGERDPFACIDKMGISATIVDRLVEINRKMWHTFGTESQYDEHTSLIDIQRSLIKSVDDAWQQDSSLQSRVSSLLLPADRRPFVQLAVPCYHFGQSYFGNRVAAQFLARAIASRPRTENGGLAPFRVGVRCIDLIGIDGHRCGDDVEACRRTPHEAVFESIVCPNATNAAPPLYIDECCSSAAIPAWKATVDVGPGRVTFDHIIVRFASEVVRPDLPDNVLNAINKKSKTLLRDVPPFYFG
jgi:hypothetical protein